ncbi:MAG: hypothetical protein LKG21_05920 [Ruminococcus sp.]|jgi:hypothetical protein|nr:hypothetical protein [Ruminococcus sp.]
MNSIVIVSVAVLLIIAAIEGFCLFFGHPEKNNLRDFALVIPILPQDGSLKEKLSEIKYYLKYSDFPPDCTILLVDYGADDKQSRIIQDFCAGNSNAHIIPYSALEKKLSEIFAISVKI